MIITPNPSLSLKVLEKALRDCISSELNLQKVELNCVQKDHNLVVLIQTPETLDRIKSKLWKFLRKTFLAEEVTFQEVLVYLIITNQHQPRIITHTIHLRGTKNKKFPPDFLPNTIFNSPTKSIILPSLSPSETHKNIKNNLNQINKFSLNNFLNQFKTNQQAKLLTSGGIGFLFFLALGYGLTRPCVLGKCELIPQSQQLLANYAESLNNQPTLEKLNEIQEKITETIKILETIPWWSSYHQEAEQLHREYQAQLEQIEQLIVGFNFAKQAHTMSKNASLAVDQLEEIKVLWQQAVTTLRNILGATNIGFVELKIREYEKNVNYLNQQIKREQEALVNLKAAQEAIKLAQARQSVSQTLENWQLVEATWRTAIDRLKAISSNTTSFPQAKELLTQSEPKLLESIKQKNQEENAINYHNIALQEAKLAKESELINQWSVAVAHWRNATNYLQKIPVNTYQYAQAQALVNSYQKFFEDAQVKLRAVMKLENANRELEKICSSMSKICNYVMGDNTIQVHLTPTYMQDVWQRALEAKAQANLTNQVQVLNHISTLEKNLETISKNTAMTVELYNSEGVLILTYKPQK